MTTDAFEHESFQDPQTIKQFLQSLVTGIEKGRIVLSTDGQELELHPAGLLKFSLRARTNEASSKLSIKVSWRNQGKNSLDAPGTMTITT